VTYPYLLVQFEVILWVHTDSDGSEAAISPSVLETTGLGRKAALLHAAIKTRIVAAVIIA